MSRILRAAGRIVVGLATLLVAFLAIAAASYYSPGAADRPCEGCSGEATIARVDGFDLYVRDIGSDLGNPPIVILHGGPGHSSDSFHRSLDFLAEEYRVVYYDQRGSGHSQIRADPSLYTIDLLVRELETLRQDVVAADRMILVAHSAGGALAQRYAIAHPDHVDRLVLVSTIPINNGVDVPILWDVFGPAFLVLGAGFPPSTPAEANEWFARTLVETSVPRLYDPADRGLLEDSGMISFATWREVSRSLEGADYRDSLARLPIPTLAIYGVADGPTSGRAVATEICETLPICTLLEFDQSGHWPFLEEPDRFANVVRAFLEEP
jgi:proline iminopeptidase